MISSQDLREQILSARTSGLRYEKGKWDRNVKSANVSLRTASARGWKTPAGSAGRGSLSMRTSSVHAAVDVDNQTSTTNVNAARNAKDLEPSVAAAVYARSRLRLAVDAARCVK